MGTRTLSLFLAAGLLLAAGTAAAQKPVNANTVAERMNKNKYSSAEVKTYLKDLKGRTVTADGRIKDMMTGKTGNRIVLSVKAGKSNNFVVDVYADNIKTLHKGDEVSCTGTYVKYNPFTVNGITLKDGVCSKR
jgi:hypothetical protein